VASFWLTKIKVRNGRGGRKEKGGWKKRTKVRKEFFQYGNIVPPFIEEELGTRKKSKESTFSGGLAAARVKLQKKRRESEIEREEKGLHNES